MSDLVYNEKTIKKWFKFALEDMLLGLKNKNTHNLSDLSRMILEVKPELKNIFKRLSEQISFQGSLL